MTKSYISREQAYAISSYVEYLPGEDTDGDIWLATFTDKTGKNVAMPVADTFRLGVIKPKREDLLHKILTKFGIFKRNERDLVNRAAGDDADVMTYIDIPIRQETNTSFYVPNNMEQAFDEGIAMLTKYSDFTFPLKQKDVDFLNTILKKLNALIRGTAYDQADIMWKLHYVEFIASLRRNYLHIGLTSPYMSDPHFRASAFLNNIYRHHTIAKAIGADTDKGHMHHGTYQNKLQGLALINEPSK